MRPNEEFESNPISPHEDQPPPEILFGPAQPAEIDGIIDLMLVRPPAYWMRKVSQSEIRAFVTYAVAHRKAVIMTARPQGGLSPIGYVFAILDSRGFWSGFFIRNPLLAVWIVFHRLMRLRQRRRKEQNRVKRNPATAGLPAFAWSPSREACARIIGLYVRKEYHDQGIAMDLYFSLFDALRARNCARVEEYAAPNYADFAGKFPKVCGWSLQPCVCGGYKISRTL